MTCNLFLYSVFVCCCLIHCYTDMKKMLLYDVVSLAMIIAGLCFRWLQQDLAGGFYGLLIVGCCFFVLFLLAQGGMGFGDVELAFALGAWLGWQQGLLCLLLALCLGSVIGIFILLKGNGRKQRLPFAPYMCLSGLFMLGWGQRFLSWYLSFFD